MHIEKMMEAVLENPEEVRETLRTRFGSVEKALEGDYRDLVRAVGKESNGLVLMSLLPHLTRYVELEAYGKTPLLDGLSVARKYLESVYIGAGKESCCLLCLNRRFRLIHSWDMTGGSPVEVSLDMRRMAEEAMRCEASYVIMAHNHPSGILHFSLADLQVTRQAALVLQAVGVHLLEHVLVTRKGSCTARGDGLFDEVTWPECENEAAVRKWLRK